MFGCMEMEGREEKGNCFFCFDKIKKRKEGRIGGKTFLWDPPTIFPITKFLLYH